MSSAEKLSTLYDMGFSMEDCKKSLDINKMKLTEAAVWLTENAVAVERSKSGDGGLNITGIEVSVRGEDQVKGYIGERHKCRGEDQMMGNSL